MSTSQWHAGRPLPSGASELPRGLDLVSGTGAPALTSDGVAKFRDLAPSNNAVFLALRERVYDGMRKAGVSER